MAAALHYRIRIVIQSIKDQPTRKIFKLQGAEKIPQEVQRPALRKLRILNNAVNLNDLRVPPNNQLRRMLGQRAGQYGIHVHEHWRLCFEWSDGQAYNVEVVEHKRNG